MRYRYEVYMISEDSLRIKVIELLERSNEWCNILF